MAANRVIRPRCRAGRDGDCWWEHCPQDANNRADYQPHCPLDNLCPECLGEESYPSCRCGGEGFIPHSPEVLAKYGHLLEVS